MAYIETHSLTKDYGHGRGIFDVNLSVERGEVFGFAGINGAGKTTTIRHLMGFLKPQAGSASIAGLDCWKDSARIKHLVGYVPGEIAFPNDGTGSQFLQRQMALQGKVDMSYCQDLCERFQLDSTAPLKSMSKGMKQKTAIIAAFVCRPDILILDEPATGLDPLMRDTFLALVQEQQARGCTIFMSSHTFEEMERTCDHVALIREGRIATIANVESIRHSKEKTFKVECRDKSSFDKLLSRPYNFIHVQPEDLQLTICLPDSQIGTLMEDLSQCSILFFKEIKHSLEEYFHSIFKEVAKHVSQVRF